MSGGNGNNSQAREDTIMSGMSPALGGTSMSGGSGNSSPAQQSFNARNKHHCETHGWNSSHTTDKCKSRSNGNKSSGNNGNKNSGSNNGNNNSGNNGNNNSGSNVNNNSGSTGNNNSGSNGNNNSGSNGNNNSGSNGNNNSGSNGNTNSHGNGNNNSRGNGNNSKARQTQCSKCAMFGHVDSACIIRTGNQTPTTVRIPTCLLAEPLLLFIAPLATRPTTGLSTAATGDTTQSSFATAVASLATNETSANARQRCIVCVANAGNHAPSDCPSDAVRKLARLTEAAKLTRRYYAPLNPALVNTTPVYAPPPFNPGYQPTNGSQPHVGPSQTGYSPQDLLALAQQSFRKMNQSKTVGKTPVDSQGILRNEQYILQKTILPQWKLNALKGRLACDAHLFRDGNALEALYFRHKPVCTRCCSVGAFYDRHLNEIDYRSAPAVLLHLDDNISFSDHPAFNWGIFVALNCRCGEEFHYVERPQCELDTMPRWYLQFAHEGRHIPWL